MPLFFRPNITGTSGSYVLFPLSKTLLRRTPCLEFISGRILQVSLFYFVEWIYKAYYFASIIICMHFCGVVANNFALDKSSALES